MIGSGDPQGGVPLHAFVTYQDILQRVVAGMPYMKLSRNVGRRNNDGERFLFGIPHALEIIAVDPHLVDLFLHGLGIVGFRKLFHLRTYLSEKNNRPVPKHGAENSAVPPGFIALSAKTPPLCNGSVPSGTTCSRFRTGDSGATSAYSHEGLQRPPSLCA